MTPLDLHQLLRSAQAANGAAATTGLRRMRLGTGVTTPAAGRTAWYARHALTLPIAPSAAAVMEGMGEWQARPLDRVYPVVFIDCINVKIRVLSTIL
jgi:hypothetical protein